MLGFSKTRIGSDLSVEEQKYFDDVLLPEWQLLFPNKPIHQLRYQLEHYLREQAAIADRKRRFDQDMEWKRGEKARNEEAAAAEEQRKKDVLKAQAELQAKQAAEIVRTQEAAKLNIPKRESPNYEAEDKYLAKVKAANSAPDRVSNCPTCRQPVRLVGGRLPKSHVIITVDPHDQMKERKTCWCYGDHF